MKTLLASHDEEIVYESRQIAGTLRWDVLASYHRLLANGQLKEESMRIAIFGAGRAAGYFAARLAQAGEEVIFIARGEHLRAIQQHGLHVESVGGDVTVRLAHATSDPAEVGSVDAVILGVKTFQVPESAEAMHPLVGPETVVLPLQNGVEVSEQLAEVLGRGHVLGGLASIISFIAAPGRLRHQGGPSSIALAELDNRPSERLERMRAALERAGISVSVPANIQAALWSKFLFVISLGGVGAVTRAPAGVLRRLPETRSLLEGAMQEVRAHALARGVPVSEDEVPRAMAVIDSLPEDGTTSLQRDIMAGSPSELEAWNCAAVRLSRSAGVPVPTQAFIYHALLPQERRARGQERFD
jgi:2-dehydropantoate 2-reductase